MPQKKLTTSTPHQRPMSRPPIRNTSNLNSNSCSEIHSDNNYSEEKRTVKFKTKQELTCNPFDAPDNYSTSESGAATTDADSSDDSSVDRSVGPHVRRTVDRGVGRTVDQSVGPSSREEDDNKGQSKLSILCCIVLTIAAVLYAYFPNSSAEKPAEVHTIARVRKDFKSQSDDLWASFEAGVNDVAMLNKPSIFIFLYKEEAEETLNRLLDKLGQLAACNITSCSQEPLELTSKTLNSPQILDDYGIILERYRGDLKEKGVLIVKRLEKVSGTSAQAFHSICDEFTPIVSKLLIMFTIKVEKEPSSSKESFELVEKLLRKPWQDENENMKPEAFNALIARITNMIIQVHP